MKVIIVILSLTTLIAADLFGDSSEERAIKQEGLVNTLVSSVAQHKEDTVNKLGMASDLLEQLNTLTLIIATATVTSAVIQGVLTVTKIYKHHIRKQAMKLTLPK